MTSNFLLGLQGLLTNIWRIFTSIKFPGTNFTFAHLLCFLIFVPLALGFFKSILGFGGLNSAEHLIRDTSSTSSVQRNVARANNRIYARLNGRKR